MSRFINNLKRRVAKEQKKIVLPESESRRVLQAAERVQAEGFARPILIGRPQALPGPSSSAVPRVSSKSLRNTRSIWTGLKSSTLKRTP